MYRIASVRDVKFDIDTWNKIIFKGIKHKTYSSPFCSMERKKRVFKKKISHANMSTSGMVYSMTIWINLVLSFFFLLKCPKRTKKNKIWKYTPQASHHHNGKSVFWINHRISERTRPIHGSIDIFTFFVRFSFSLLLLL